MFKIYKYMMQIYNSSKYDYLKTTLIHLMLTNEN